MNYITEKKIPRINIHVDKIFAMYRNCGGVIEQEYCDNEFKTSFKLHLSNNGFNDNTILGFTRNKIYKQAIWLVAFGLLYVLPVVFASIGVLLSDANNIFVYLAALLYIIVVIIGLVGICITYKYHTSIGDTLYGYKYTKSKYSLLLNLYFILGYKTPETHPELFVNIISPNSNTFEEDEENRIQSSSTVDRVTQIENENNSTPSTSTT